MDIVQNIQDLENENFENNKWGLSWAALSQAGVKPGVGVNRLL